MEEGVTRPSDHLGGCCRSRSRLSRRVELWGVDNGTDGQTYKILYGFSLFPIPSLPRRSHHPNPTGLDRLISESPTMRFLSSVFILSALSVLQVLARMNQLVSRTSHDHPTIARRQFHPSARSLVDICAQIDVSLSSKLSVVKILEASALVELHVCLCVSVVATFVKNDVRAKPYIDHFGEKNAITEIKELVGPLDAI